MLRIDGSLGEGGGQTVRTALSLAAVTRREVEIVNIRRARRNPGLRHDLIATARAVATITHGRLEGDGVGSDALRFYPGTASSGRYEFTVGDATVGTGSVTLVLQTIAPVLALASGTSEVIIHGATHGPFSPTATYLQTVFVPTAKKFGFRGDVATARWGWAPHGLGELRARIESVTAFRAASLSQRGEMLQIGGTTVSTDLDEGFAERQKDRVQRRMSEVGRQAQVQCVRVGCDAKGGMVFLLAVFEQTIAGFTGMVLPTSSAEQVADDAVNELFDYITSYSVLDKHLGDQVLVYAALADGISSFSVSKLTAHTKTTAEVIEQLLPARISFVGQVGEPSEVEIIGAGFTR